MKRLATLLLVTCASIAPAVAAPDPGWYVAHMKTETCVPIGDVGPDGDRVYYGAGSMRTPVDWADFMAQHGLIVSFSVFDHGFVLTGTVKGYPPTTITLFNDLAWCQGVMAQVQQ